MKLSEYVLHCKVVVYFSTDEISNLNNGLSIKKWHLKHWAIYPSKYWRPNVFMAHLDTAKTEETHSEQKKDDT